LAIGPASMTIYVRRVEGTAKIRRGGLISEGGRGQPMKVSRSEQSRRIGGRGGGK